MTTGYESETIIPERRSEAKAPTRVLTYNFRRPDRFSMDQIRNLSLIHENFARLTTTSLCGTLRMQTEVHVTAVDQMTFGEFMKSRPLPAVLNILQMNPLNRPALLTWDSPLGVAFIERLTGGTGELKKVDRELSPGERKLTELLLVRMMKNLDSAWSEITELQPRLSHIEHNAEFAQIVAPSEMIVLVSFEVILPSGKSKMDLCIPYLSIESLLPQLSGMKYIKSRFTGPGTGSTITSRVNVESEIYYSTEMLSLAQLGSLKKGSLVELPDYGKGLAKLAIGGVPIIELCRESGKPRRNTEFTVVGKQKDHIQGARLLFSNEVAGNAHETRYDKLSETVEVILSRLESAFSKLGEQMEGLNHRQDEIIDAIAHTGMEYPNMSTEELSSQPFSFVDSNDVEMMSLYLGVEHPQFTALILSHLDRADSAAILSAIPAEWQVEVARRMAQMDWVGQDVIKTVEAFLREKFSSSGDEFIHTAKGVDIIAEVLNVSPRKTEKNVVESLEKIDASLAEEIKKRMFVFEDIVLLEPESFSKLVDRISEQDLIVSLKTVVDEVRNFIYSSLENEASKRISDSVDRLGRMKLSDVEVVQQRIIEIIREMEECGEISIARPDEVVE